MDSNFHTCWTVVTTVVPVLVFEDMLATCVPANAKKRKEVVPTNSPITATVWPRLVGGRRCSSERSGLEADVGALVFMLKEIQASRIYGILTRYRTKTLGQRFVECQQ